jgi:hypothetical protein
MTLTLRTNQMTQKTINLQQKPMKLWIHRTKLMIKLITKRKVKRLQEMAMVPRLEMSKTMKIKKRLTPKRKRKPNKKSIRMMARKMSKIMWTLLLKTAVSYQSMRKKTLKKLIQRRKKKP